MSKSQASTWVRVFGGYYRRIGSDGVTVIAEVSHDEDGTWSYEVKPFGKAQYAWQVTGKRTMDEAKRGAAAGYRRYMEDHRKLNAR